MTVALWISSDWTVAVEVGPTTDVTIDGGTFVAPTGDVVATQEHPITLSYTINLPEGATVLDNNVFDTTLRSQVLRDQLTQRLTFVYQVDPLAGRALSLKEGNVIVSAFGDFFTDVSSPISWFGSRSADGNTITAETTGIGDGEMLNFVVATNATEFDSTGTAEVFFQNVFPIDNPTEPLQDQATLAASVTTSGVFQPAVDAGGGGGGGGGGAIPLPSAAWTGLVGLATGALLAGAKRVRFA
jgi:hypothetical protein